MTDADNKEQTSDQSQNQNAASTGNTGALDAKLAEVQAQLAAMNQAFQAQAQAISSLTPKPAPAAIQEDDIFDPQAMQKKVTQVIEQSLADERKKNATIGQLAMEYPEIHSDRELMSAIVAAQKGLPQQLQDTAEGYEMAVLKATSQRGLVPKSKRKQQSSDDDFSFGGNRGSGESRRQSSGKKVSEKTIAVAELLRGRSLTDAEIKGLEEATKRDSYNRYR